ncbi:MAG: hypothetical protein ABSC89_14425 [Verrucomicrobiota bacterium]|jgi:hypothetical protein
MNKLNTEKRVQILRCLVDGSSIRATSRLTDTAITVLGNFVGNPGDPKYIAHIEPDRFFRSQATSCVGMLATQNQIR